MNYSKNSGFDVWVFMGFLDSYKWTLRKPLICGGTEFNEVVCIVLNKLFLSSGFDDMVSWGLFIFQVI